MSKKNTTLSSIIGAKNNAKKLAAIIALVATARAKYNNEDTVIDAPTITTATGCSGIKYLETSDKAAVATRELKTILCEVNTLDADVQGVNVNRELTGMIATNAILVNLEDSLSLELE